MKARSGSIVFALAGLAAVSNGAHAQTANAQTFVHTYDYRSARPELEISTSDTVAVAVQDRRPYVISRSKPETFVGLLRSGFGIPLDVYTKSGQPLASDLGVALLSAFAFNKVQATSVRVAPADSRERIAALLQEAAASKALLLTLDEWKTDALANMKLSYRIRAELLDRSGKVIAENLLQGVDALASHPNGAQLMEKKVGELLRGPITSALQGAPAAAATPAAARASGPALLQQIQCKVGDAPPKPMTRVACSQQDGLVVEN